MNFRFTDAFYDPISSVTMSKYDHKRTPGFGIGRRCSHQDKVSEYVRQLPGPTSYTVRSSFERASRPNHPHQQKGFSFRNTAEAYKKVYSKEMPKIGSGPDKYYDIKSFVDLNLAKNGRKISLGRKPKPTKTDKESEPGPG